ncbi:hypothetical protein GF360_00405 [candidate division WWE3 bacterium]|nr:hypothetical protein [candidate division WWE3 bacterium]
MEIINKKSAVWAYMEGDIQGLISDGESLLDLPPERDQKVSDFSYLVFPFAKAYEGFLKKLFLDMDVINEEDFYGDEIRVGRILSPRYRKSHSRQFGRMCLKETKKVDLADELWETWHRGRNRVFHYFPHNFRRLSYEEALDIIQEIGARMEQAVGECGLGLAEDSLKRASEVTSIV